MCDNILSAVVNLMDLALVCVAYFELITIVKLGLCCFLGSVGWNLGKRLVEKVL